jgi:type I restriction enzyme M protein
MIDASKGFMKDGPKNRLRSQDIHRIVDAFNSFTVKPGYSRMVGFGEIEKNEFNLNLPRYIESQETEDIQDIAGHLFGGIPIADIDALQQFWDVCPTLRKSLFRESRDGYRDLAVEMANVKNEIFSHPEFESFIDDMNDHFAKWRKKTAKQLRQLEPGHKPKELIIDVSERLLDHYRGKPLIDPYAVYQHLMDYWADVMQDDCYSISADGWKAETERVIEKDKSGKPKDKGWVCDLVPKPLIVARYFRKEQDAIDQLNAELETLSGSVTELEEEHDRPVDESFSDLRVLTEYLRLGDEITATKAKIREAEAALDVLAYEKYPHLTEDEIKTLVVDDKWMNVLDSKIHGEMDRISQSLAGRVKELAERYETPMPQLVQRATEFENRVSKHLARMGFPV